VDVEKKHAQEAFEALYPKLPVAFIDFEEGAGMGSDERVPGQFMAEIETSNGRHEWFYDEESRVWNYYGFIGSMTGETYHIYCPTLEELQIEVEFLKSLRKQ
jgi:hypothetical protein